MALIDSIVVRYIRFDGCDVFVSALELFNFYIYIFFIFIFNFVSGLFV